MKPKNNYGDTLHTLALSLRTNGKISPDFMDELRRQFNELGERVQAAEQKAAQLEKQLRDLRP